MSVLVMAGVVDIHDGSFIAGMSIGDDGGGGGSVNTGDCFRVCFENV